MAKVQTQDGQILYAANDLFIGICDHRSARYDITHRGRRERQSSSGVIVSTGLGMSGWHKSIMAQLRGMAKAFSMGALPPVNYRWDERKLRFTVREPYESRTTSAQIVYGEITGNELLTMRSDMAEGGVIFSDGVLEDAIEFNSGMEIKIGIAEKQGRLVV